MVPMDTSDAAIEALCRDVLHQHAGKVYVYRKGKTMPGFFVGLVGRVMRRAKGRLSPLEVQRCMFRLLEDPAEPRPNVTDASTPKDG